MSRRLLGTSWGGLSCGTALLTPRAPWFLYCEDRGLTIWELVTVVMAVTCFCFFGQNVSWERITADLVLREVFEGRTV